VVTLEGERWRAMLAAWAIPDAILAQAPASPWGLSVELFAARPDAPLTPSHRAARRALDPPGSVLDIGAGGGAMSLPLRDLATRIVAVDTSEAMLESCVADATVLGSWPEVAGRVPPADVVVCGNVLYNVPALEDFLLAATAAARRRVVMEITERHPRDVEWERALWLRFWALERPTSPVWSDVMEVAGAAGISPEVERWTAPRHRHASLDALVAEARRRLCLAPERDAELRAALAGATAVEDQWLFSAEPRRMVTLAWDGSAP
jgi:SAM-dependent methyltransferase